MAAARAQEGRVGLTARDVFIAPPLLPDIRAPIRGASGLGVTAGAAVLSFEV